MARGWESKSIEAQQADAVEKPAVSRRKLTPDEANQLREKDNLRLARQRVLQQLETATNARHKKLLEDSLAELEKKLAKLES